MLSMNISICINTKAKIGSTLNDLAMYRYVYYIGANFGTGKVKQKWEGIALICVIADYISAEVIFDC